MSETTDFVLDYLKEHEQATIREVCEAMYGEDDRRNDPNGFARHYNRIRSAMSQLSRKGAITRVEDCSDPMNPRCMWMLGNSPIEKS